MDSQVNQLEKDINKRMDGRISKKEGKQWKFTIRQCGISYKLKFWIDTHGAGNKKSNGTGLEHLKRMGEKQNKEEKLERNLGIWGA